MFQINFAKILSFFFHFYNFYFSLSFFRLPLLFENEDIIKIPNQSWLKRNPPFSKKILSDKTYYISFSAIYYLFYQPTNKINLSPKHAAKQSKYHQNQ